MRESREMWRKEVREIKVELKNGNSGVFIDNDLTKEERKIQKIIRQRAYRERGKVTRLRSQETRTEGESGGMKQGSKTGEKMRKWREI